jgi:ribonucleoside-diphosphate reductase alpha chain
MELNEWIGNDNKIGIDIFNKKYRYNQETFDQWLNRVSGGNDTIKQLIIDKKFLFGGRILANRGIPGNKTYSNCYVIAKPEDNLESIFDAAKKLARTFSYGGGCGIDIGKLCPKDAKVNNTAKKSSGAVSFMDLYNLTTGLIGQNGRRGALMISMPVNHPDIEDFINIKSDLNKITQANISVRVDDKFMNAVKNNKDYELTFTRPENGESITRIVNAKDLFHKICEMNWNYAEPGVLF